MKTRPFPMRFLTLPLFCSFSFTALTPLLAADPLAASLPGDSTLFFNVRDLTKMRQIKDHPLAKAFITGELGKFMEPLLKKMQGEIDTGGVEIFKEETGLSLEELLAKFPDGFAGSLSLGFEKMMKDDEEKPEMAATLVADFTGDEALMARIVTALDKMDDHDQEVKKKAEAEDGKKADGDKDAADDGGEESGEDEDADTGEDELPKADWPADYEENVTEIGGVKVHEWSLREPGKKSGDGISWSVAKGKAAFAIGKTDFKELVTRLATPSDTGSLAATPAWKTIPDADRDSDVLMGVNLETMLGEIQEGLRVKMEKGELNTGLPINPLQAWTAVGLDQLRAAFISTSVGTEDAAMHLGLTYAEKPAILKIYAATGPGVAPAFVPSDVQEVSWGTLDWGKMFDNIKEMAIAISPLAGGGIDMGLNEAKNKIGIDLRTDLFGQLGDNLWSVSHVEALTDEEKAKAKAKKSEDQDSSSNPFAALAASQAGQSQVIGIALRDSKAFALSLKTMINTLASEEALFDNREFMGKTIHQIKGTPPEMNVAWLIDNDTLILSIGKTELLEKILGGMEKKPATPLIEAAHVKAALAKLPEGGVSSSYMDAGQTIDAVIGMLKPLIAEQASGETADTINSFPDKLDIGWQLVSRLHLAEKSTDVNLRLSNKP
jgi:hypothetical protein